MNKKAPSTGRLIAAAGFALSCFGLLTFIWVAFGGPTPLKARGYQIKAYFPEAISLARESGVRISGVPVGKVKSIKLAPENRRINGKDTTEAVLEIDHRYAPIASDARAILRQKTLLGESYVELTRGSPTGAGPSLGSGAQRARGAPAAKPVPEGGTLPATQISDATQIDEVFNVFDKRTRDAFRALDENGAIALRGRGEQLNNAIGLAAPALTDTARLVAIAKRQRDALHGLVRDTGTVFAAATQRGNELAGAVDSTDQVFRALASEDRALAETVRIVPTSEAELTKTLGRFDRFRQKAAPVVHGLVPVAQDISPTIASVRRLSPDLSRLFVKLGPVLDAAKPALPGLTQFVDQLRPVLNALDPSLANVNPGLRYVRAYRKTITDFLGNVPATLSGIADPIPGEDSPHHLLPLLTQLGPEDLSVYPQRISSNRGNSYLTPDALTSAQAAAAQIFPNFDCKNTDYGITGSAPPDEDEILPGQSKPGINGGQPPGGSFPPCVITPGFGGVFGGAFGSGRAPQVAVDP